MGRRVYKFEAEQDGSYAVPFKNAEAAHFDMQYRTWPTLWCEVDADSEGETTTFFRIFGTGHEIAPNHKRVMSCIDRTTGLVWHLYKTGTTA